MTAPYSEESHCVSLREATAETNALEALRQQKVLRNPRVV